MTGLSTTVRPVRIRSQRGVNVVAGGPRVKVQIGRIGQGGASASADFKILVGLMDGETQQLLPYLAFNPTLIGEQVLLYDGTDATIGTLTSEGELTDTIDLFDGDHDLAVIVVASSLRNNGGSVRYGEHWHVQPADPPAAYELISDGMIDVRIREHEGRPNAHRISATANRTLLDDTARRAINDAFFDGTMGVASGGPDLYTFCAVPGGTIVSKVVDGELGIDPVLVETTGGDGRHDVAMVEWDDETGLYVSFTHAGGGEDQTSFIGIATWDGYFENNFEVLGPAVVPNIGIGSGGAANNIGSFTPVIHFGDYMYAFHKDQLANGTVVKLAVSRVNRRDMFDAAALGNVEPWSKWNGTDWSQPGIEGVAADVAPEGWSHTHANVALLDETDELVLIATSSGTPLFGSYSRDGVTWSPVVGIEDHHDGYRDDYATLYSGEPSRPNVIRRGDRAVIWTARCALGDTPLQDETWIVEQLLTGWGIDGTPVGAGSGDVVGPASSTDGRPAGFDGTSGKTLKQLPISGPNSVVLRTAGNVIADDDIPSSIVRESEMAAAIAAALDALLDGAPGALDTLNELAAAINDDASFAASVTTALAGKQAASSELSTLAALTSTAAGRAILTAANYGAIRALLDLEVGTDVQAHSAKLDTLAALASSDAGYVLDGSLGWRKRDTTVFVDTQSPVTTDNTAKVIGSLTLPALDAGDTVEVTFWGSVSNASGGSISFTPSLRLGSTTVATMTAGAVATGTTMNWWIKALIRNITTSSQKALVESFVNNGNTPRFTPGTAAESTTGTSTLSAVLQGNVATATQSATMTAALAKVIRA